MPLPQSEKAKNLLQKAYLKYSTQRELKTKTGDTGLKSHWQQQIQQEQKVHAEILHKIQLGERVEGIEKDPLDSKETDVVYDYSSVPGFLQREKSSVSGEEKLRVKPSHQSIQQVEKLMQKFKQKREEHKKGLAAGKDGQEEEEGHIKEEEEHDDEEAKHEDEVPSKAEEEQQPAKEEAQAAPAKEELVIIEESVIAEVQPVEEKKEAEAVDVAASEPVAEGIAVEEPKTEER